MFLATYTEWELFKYTTSQSLKHFFSRNKKNWMCLEWWFLFFDLFSSQTHSWSSCKGNQKVGLNTVPEVSTIVLHLQVVLPSPSVQLISNQLSGGKEWRLYCSSNLQTTCSSFWSLSCCRFNPWSTSLSSSNCSFLTIVVWPTLYCFPKYVIVLIMDVVLTVCSNTAIVQEVYDNLYQLPMLCLHPILQESFKFLKS